jgi:adenylosuccinate synthase
MANLISEQQRKRHASCCMGIWNTIKRTEEMGWYSFDRFLNSDTQLQYLNWVKEYYERNLSIPDEWKPIWNSPNIAMHFVNDCRFMEEHTIPCDMSSLTSYENLIFENGQGLLLCDNGKDTYDTTPSNTGVKYALEMLNELGVKDITAHYVTRPYLTRHGDGNLFNESARRFVSSGVEEDRTNHFNDGQGEFRYGLLDIGVLKDRVLKDAGLLNVELEVTHCDEMDRVSEFRRAFGRVNTYDSPFV